MTDNKLQNICTTAGKAGVQQGEKRKSSCREDRETASMQGKNILLHACCAPCSSAIIEYMAANGLKPVVFYSNSNIVPKEEYEKRRDECARYCKEYGMEFVEDCYDHNDWLSITRNLEDAPERGSRCLQCFRYRLERAARYAREHGRTVLTTTLASSRWKNLDQVNDAGEYATGLFPGVDWWPRNWRKGGLQERRNFLIKELGFYNQLYCGCEFSSTAAKQSLDKVKEQ